MRKIFFVAFLFAFTTAGFAQNSDSLVKKELLTSRATARSSDHFMLQIGYLQWAGRPDTVNVGGIPRTANVYFLMDFPFRTNRHLSAAIGAGVASDNMYFKKTNIDIKEAGTTAVRFRNVADTNHFKKYKLATTYLEVPLELRFTANPDDDRRSIKAALGLKAGRLVNVHTKGKNLQNRGGNTINDYKMKEFSKRFFNDNRFSATARIGFGHYSLFGSYQITTLFKEGMGPAIRPVVIGLNISGL